MDSHPTSVAGNSVVSDETNDAGCQVDVNILQFVRPTHTRLNRLSSGTSVEESLTQGPAQSEQVGGPDSNLIPQQE
ncbi:hypothetical protein PIB30_050707 [Stylosanthes scabra]|uniref:Uncharacterized protein n=1 Tax=Stylosanthes scabra TaxID=79078 RepID=A0ABU6UJ71_9FABA|nr:hypothetical protein [Stylosanthes scabra]